MLAHLPRQYSSASNAHCLSFQMHSPPLKFYSVNPLPAMNHMLRHLTILHLRRVLNPSRFSPFLHTSSPFAFPPPNFNFHLHTSTQTHNFHLVPHTENCSVTTVYLALSNHHLERSIFYHLVGNSLRASRACKLLCTPLPQLRAGGRRLPTSLGYRHYATVAHYWWIIVIHG